MLGGDCWSLRGGIPVPFNCGALGSCTEAAMSRGGRPSWAMGADVKGLRACRGLGCESAFEGVVEIEGQS